MPLVLPFKDGVATPCCVVPETHAASIQLMTKAKSVALGRRLYVCEDKQLWWKTHVAVDTVEQQQLHQQFRHELACYQYFAQQQCTFLLPFQMCQGCHETSTAYGAHVLQIAHAAGLFDVPAQALPLDQVIHRIFLALNTLEELHALGFIHADLKHEHLRFDGKQAKLIDFEYCQQQGRANTSTLMQATPRYMAPELFHGQEKSLQSDLYALGIIFLEWLQGERLQAKSYFDWAVLHCQQSFIQLPEPFLRFGLLLEGLLAKQMTQRFMHVGAVKRCLMTEIA